MVFVVVLWRIHTHNTFQTNGLLVLNNRYVHEHDSWLMTRSDWLTLGVEKIAEFGGAMIRYPNMKWTNYACSLLSWVYLGTSRNQPSIKCIWQLHTHHRSSINSKMFSTRCASTAFWSRFTSLERIEEMIERLENICMCGSSSSKSLRAQCNAVNSWSNTYNKHSTAYLHSKWMNGFRSGREPFAVFVVVDIFFFLFFCCLDLSIDMFVCAGLNRVSVCLQPLHVFFF